MILLQDDKHLGEKYEIVAVKPIFARNVLLPQNIAVLADKANKNKYEQKMQAAVVARAKKAAGLDDLFVKMAENGGVTITRKVNKDNVLYAKVHESDVVEAIKEAYGVDVDSHLFKLKKKINEAGTFVVPFMYKDMKKEVTVIVKPEHIEKVQIEKVQEDKSEEAPVATVEKTKEELKAEREAKKAAEKAEKIAKLKEKYK